MLGMALLEVLTVVSLALAAVVATGVAEKVNKDSSRRLRSRVPPKSSCACRVLPFPTKT